MDCFICVLLNPIEKKNIFTIYMNFCIGKFAELPC